MIIVLAIAILIGALIMGASLDNLNASVTRLTASVDRIVALPPPGAGEDPVAVQAAADAVNAQSDRLDAVQPTP
jgi:hypothetical protein